MGILLIAEAGVNHNGSLALAKKMIKAAKDAGADCIKFQTYNTEQLVTRNAAKAHYQIEQTKGTESQFDMLRRLELSKDDFMELKRYCSEVMIEFLSTPFDRDSVRFLNEIGIRRWKVPSGEITNLPYLEDIAATGKEVLLSTGMAELEEIGAALSVLRKNPVQLLHCTTEYPASFRNANLNAICAMRERFGVPVGFSDHTPGIEAAIAAAALGASVIEKHFTLDRDMEGPDHKASLTPEELRQMVSSVRHVELALGSGVKRPFEPELLNRPAVRKSIVAGRRILAGEVLTEDNLAVKRPGTGISPMRWHELLGTRAVRDFEAEEQITEEEQE